MVTTNGGRRATATSNFGVSKRENHDATAFYQRFTTPDLSTDETVLPPFPIPDPVRVGDARAMTDLPDGSVALVVTTRAPRTDATPATLGRRCDSEPAVPEA